MPRFYFKVSIEIYARVYLVQKYTQIFIVLLTHVPLLEWQA